jgi:hypothetical protein
VLHRQPPIPLPCCRTCFLSLAGRSLSTSVLRRRIITVLVSSLLSSSSFWLPSCRQLEMRNALLRRLALSFARQMKPWNKVHSYCQSQLHALHPIGWFQPHTAAQI